MISSKADFIHIFNCLFVLRLNVPVNNFSVMSGRTFLMILYMYIAPRQEHATLGDKTLCQQKALITLPIRFKFKKRNPTLCTFLMNLYIYIAPGQVQTTPWGQTFDVNRKALSF